MDYYRPAFTLNRPPLFQPRMEHFNFNYGPGPFHPSAPPFALTTPSGISLYLQRPPPPPIPLPMLPGGPYMHNHHQQHQPRDPRRQRPSRRVRQRVKRQPERLKGEDESREETSESTPLASESGYDTTGDCHTPATPLDSPVIPNGGSTLMEHATASGVHSRSDSASSMNLSETSLKKLLKDLHRCEVSITKYQTMLDKNCEDGMKNLQEIFSNLHDHLNTREQSLIQKLSSVKETATSILQRRKSTASFLRQAAESGQTTLEESQILELKHQIKCFVTDRKVDEEIGTNKCFQADPDDLVRHIMGFGKVNEARHVYTVWEENPAEMINISKEQVLFPRIRNDETSSSAPQQSGPLEPETKLSDSEPESASNSISADRQADSSTETSPAPCNNTETSDTIDLLAQPKSPISPLDPAPILSPLQISPPSSPAKESSTKQTTTSTMDRHTYSYCVSATSSIKYSPRSISIKSGRPWHAVSKVATKRAPPLPKHKENVHVAPKVSDTVRNNKKSAADKEKVEQKKESSDSGSSLPGKKEEAKKEERRNQNHQCSKYSSSELQTIQSRIKDSLRQQGVYLYDPITGNGPIPTTAGTSGAGRFSSSSVDTCGERCKTEDQNTALRKKKTPTQLRRERKKRQKERERRQRELEKQQLDNKTMKDSETETKGEKEGEKKQSHQNEQTSPGPTNNAIADDNTDKHTQQDTLTGELSSSDSESSGNSPTHSSSSLTKSVDNDEPLGEDPELQNQRANLEESNEEEAVIEEEPNPASTVTESAEQEEQVPRKDKLQEEKPSTGMLTEEARGEVKINQQVDHLATLTTTQDTLLTAQQESIKEEFKPDGGIQDGVMELELELKPEE